LVKVTEFDLTRSPECGVVENDTPPVVAAHSFQR
jgi:hypothetical protein